MPLATRWACRRAGSSGARQQRREPLGTTPGVWKLRHRTGSPFGGPVEKWPGIVGNILKHPKSGGSRILSHTKFWRLGLECLEKWGCSSTIADKFGFPNGHPLMWQLVAVASPRVLNLWQKVKWILEAFWEVQ